MTDEMYYDLVGRNIRTTTVLERLYGSGLHKYVAHVNAISGGIDIHTEEGDVEAKRAGFVREFGPDRLGRYWMSMGRLAMEYCHDHDINVVYYDRQAEGRLQTISGGKCRITRESVEQITEQIVCARPE